MVLKNMLNVGAAASIGFIAAGMVAPSAFAVSLVPQAEGEVNVGFESCLGDGCSYLDVDPLISSIESLTDDSTGTRSRLFVDAAGTDNTYGGVQFLAKDIGTSEGSGDFWFRPVAMAEDGVNTLLENGQLEVGTFKFNFSRVITELNINWFDTERQGGTNYTVFDGDGLEIASGTVAAGANNNIFSSTFTNVGAIQLDLGERYGRTGDGVNFQVDVPEPGIILGLGAMVLAGTAGLRRKQENA